MSGERHALELRAIEKRYGAVAALTGASLSAHAGSVHVLLGENGAGKTTLLRVASGFVQPDSGTILIDGTPVQWSSRAAAHRAGLAVVEQHFSLVPAMTVAENVALAASPLLSRHSVSSAADRVKRIAESVGLEADPAKYVGELPVAAQQRAEIIKALATDTSILIMDEPTAVLSPAESDELFAWLRRFAGDGKTAVVITHRLREALNHGDALTVIRRGQTTLVAERGEVSQDQIVTAILGESSGESPKRGPRTSTPAAASIVAELKGVSVVDAGGVTRIHDVSFALRAGEIVGVAGVEGSGQRELLRVLSARLLPTSGSARLPAGPAFVPEDRLRDALIGEMSLVENWALRGLGAQAGLLDWPGVSAAVTRGVSSFDIRGGDVGTRASSLSGGNQQKFVLARELESSPALIIAENPTRGLDLRAAAAVIRQLTAARDAGAAVVVYTSDIEDLIDLSDRILVCFGGRIREVARDFDAIGAAMLGGR